MKLDAATFLLQWAAGGLLFGWVTTRRREVSLGYGWLIRIVVRRPWRSAARRVFLAGDHVRARVIAALPRSRACSRRRVALAVSVRRRGAGVRGREEVRAGAPGARRRR